MAASSIGRYLARFAESVTGWAGSDRGFAPLLVIVLVLGAVGPLCGFSDTWQLIINTGTTIVTFLMVFLIQRTQNKDSLATQIKLNEILAALKAASNRLINVEDLSEEEIRELHTRFEELARRAQQFKDTTRPCSIEQAVLP